MDRRENRSLDMRKLGRNMRQPQLIAFIPALLLAGYTYGGEGVLVMFAVTFPLVLLLFGMFGRSGERSETDELTGLYLRPALERRLDSMVEKCAHDNVHAMVFALEVDTADKLRSHLGSRGFSVVLRHLAQRLGACTRGTDLVARLEDHRFAVVMPLARPATQDLAEAAVDRLQSAAMQPISYRGVNLHISVSVGFCLSSILEDLSSRSLLDAAEMALEAARSDAPCAVRPYSPSLGATRDAQITLASELERALDNGEIRAWFQPQIHLATGTVSGFEALARWEHPERGLVPPAHFLPTLEAAGQMDRLGGCVLFHALSALQNWDRLGHDVPTVGVNFSSSELRNPKLIDHLKWELDRFGLAPQRLAVEVLETVVAGGADDLIAHNINRLAELGCAVDLDDFGTGHASIANIRRFAVSRLKIDRSFVSDIGYDTGQQKLVSAILAMAKNLDLDTLAEGIETEEERALLVQMGCANGQGFGIARPMPFEDTLTWLAKAQGPHGVASPAEQSTG